MKHNRKRVIALLAVFAVCFSLLTVCFAQQASTDAPITKLADLEGKKVASASGTVFSTILDEKVKNVSHLYFSDIVTMIEMMKAGKVSAVLTDEPTAQLMLRQYPDLEILQEKLSDDRYGYAIRKGDPLGPAVSGVIERFRGDGTLEQIAEKWFGADEAAKILPTLNYKSDFDGSAGTIHLAHDHGIAPMSYVGDDGKPRGYEIELLMRVAYELNMKIEMQGMAFDALLATLVSGKADIVGGSMSITEERKQSVDFTVPDYEGGMVAVVKKIRTLPRSQVT